MPECQLGFQWEAVRHVLLYPRDTGQRFVRTELSSDANSLQEALFFSGPAGSDGPDLKCRALPLQWCVCCLSLLQMRVDNLTWISCVAFLHFFTTRSTSGCLAKPGSERGGITSRFSSTRIKLWMLSINIEYGQKATSFFKGKHSLFEDVKKIMK